MPFKDGCIVMYCIMYCEMADHKGLMLHSLPYFHAVSTCIRSTFCTLDLIVAFGKVKHVLVHDAQEYSYRSRLMCTDNVLSCFVYKHVLVKSNYLSVKGKMT